MSDSFRPYTLQPTRLLCPWDSPGKNTGVGGHFLLQGIFLTQGSNPHLLHCRWILYCSCSLPHFLTALLFHKVGIYLRNAGYYSSLGIRSTYVSCNLILETQLYYWSLPLLQLKVRLLVYVLYFKETTIYNFNIWIVSIIYALSKVFKCKLPKRNKEEKS